MVIAWSASIAAGTLFYRFIESPSATQRIFGFVGQCFQFIKESTGKIPVLANQRGDGRS
jgi:hypothetical protein